MEGDVELSGATECKCSGEAVVTVSDSTCIVESLTGPGLYSRIPNSYRIEKYCCYHHGA